MHSHQVYFWLNKELSNSDLLEFEEGLRSLTKISFISSGYYGKPASTSRAVVDNSYSYGLTLLFKSIADHNFYQDSDPDHRAFVKINETKWIRVQIFDIEIT